MAGRAETRRPIGSASRRVSKRSCASSASCAPPGDEALGAAAPAGDSAEGRSGHRRARAPARARGADHGRARSTSRRCGAAAHDPDAQVRRLALRAAAAAAPQVPAAGAAQRPDRRPGGRFADRAARGAAQPAHAQRRRFAVPRRWRPPAIATCTSRCSRSISSARCGSAPDAVAALERTVARSVRAPASAARLASRRARAGGAGARRSRDAAPPRCRSSPARASGSCGCTRRGRRRS